MLHECIHVHIFSWSYLMRAIERVKKMSNSWFPKWIRTCTGFNFLMLPPEYSTKAPSCTLYVELIKLILCNGWVESWHCMVD